MNDGRDFAKGALVGVIAGAMAGVLFAPKAGKETRVEIKDTFQEIKDEVAKDLSGMKEITQKRYQQAVSGIVSGYEEAKKITPEQAKEISKILDQSFDQIEKAIKKG